MKRFTLDKQRYLAWTLLICIMLIYTLVMSIESILRYETFKATAFDLGNMDQVFWNTIHGRPFQFSNQAIDWYGPPTRLAIHFEPIILPLSLLYVFHADPRILLVFQTLALASGSFPVFLLVRKHLPEWPLLAPMMVIAYLLSPALLGLNIFDFHPVALATPLLLYAILALDARRYLWFLLACIGACACKEDIPLAVAMLGILVIWKYRLPRLGLTLIVGGALWSALAFGVIIPHFYPGLQHNNYWYRYEALGSSPGAAIINLLIHPWLLFTTFITLDRLYYLASLFRSSAFLALLAPEWLIPALPSLAVNILSTDALLYSGVFHYNAAIIPFVILAAIFGTRRLLNTWYTWREDVGTDVPRPLTNETRPLATSSLLVMFFQKPPVQRLFTDIQQRVRVIGKRLERLISPTWQRFSERMIPLAHSVSGNRLQWVIYVSIILMLYLNLIVTGPALNAFWADHWPGTREQHIQQLLAMIPADASVSASDNMNPHLSDRQNLAVFPSILDGSHHTVQYIVVDLNSIFPEDRIATTNTLNQLINSKQFRVLKIAEGVWLLKRTPTR